MSTQITEEARTIPVVSSFHLDVKAGDFMDKRNTTFGNFASNIRHVLFSTYQSNRETLEERMRQENESPSTFIAETYNTSGRKKALHYSFIFSNANCSDISERI